MNRNWDGGISFVPPLQGGASWLICLPRAALRLPWAIFVPSLREVLRSREQNEPDVGARAVHAVALSGSLAPHLCPCSLF